MRMPLRQACPRAGRRPFWPALLLTLSLLAPGLPAPGRAAGVDWYRWRGPDLNGVSKETGWFSPWPQAGPRQLWKAAVGQGYSSVSVSQGRLYTMGVVDGKETVWCLDANTGAVLWKHSYPYVFQPHYYDGGSSVTPTVDGKQIFTLGQSGELFCFDAATGKVVWSKNIQQQLQVRRGEWGFAGSPLVEGKLLILNVGSFGAAVDKATGQVVWVTGKEANGYSSAVPFTSGARRGVALLTAKAVVGVEAATGKELWRHPWKTEWDINVADPIIDGDQVFVSSSYGSGGALIQFGAQPPKVLWQTKEMQNHFNSCVLLDGHLYGVNGEAGKFADLKCLDWKTGAVKWTAKGLGMGALMAAEGKLIILSEKGELVIAAATPEAFKPLARAQVLGGKCWTTPVLSHARIYARNSRGDLVCVESRGAE